MLAVLKALSSWFTASDVSTTITGGMWLSEADESASMPYLEVEEVTESETGRDSEIELTDFSLEFRVFAETSLSAKTLLESFVRRLRQDNLHLDDVGYDLLAIEVGTATCLKEGKHVHRAFVALTFTVERTRVA